MTGAFEQLEAAILPQDTDLPYDPQEMSQRLISLGELEEGSEQQFPKIEIISDDTLAICGVHMVLSQAKIFVLNALRIAQGEARSLLDIEALGSPYKRRALRLNVTDLAKTLNSLAEVNVINIEKLPKKFDPMRFMLASEVIFLDKRANDYEQLKLTCVVRNADGSIRKDENGSLSFVSVKKRVAITRQMFEEYRGSANIDSFFASQFQDIGVRNAERAITPLTLDGRLTTEEEDILLGKKEAALSAYLSGKESLSPEDKSIIVEGVQAGYELFARSLDLVIRLATVYSRTSPFVSFEDFYQEAAAQVLNAVFVSKYQNGAETSFRQKAHFAAKIYDSQGILPLRSKAALHVSVPVAEWPAYQEVVGRMLDYYRSGKPLDPASISQETGVDTDQVAAVLNAESRPLSLDYVSDDGRRFEYNGGEPDFVDNELDRMEIEEAISLLFSSKELSDGEKVVLSLYYRVFHPSLRGIEMTTKSEVTFSYPYIEEEFKVLTRRRRELWKIGTEILGRSKNYGTLAHSRALTKARQILSKEAFSFKFETSEDLEGERETAIALAQELSPNQRMSTSLLTTLNRTGDFPYTFKHIQELFGSLPNFQRACGFEPDKTDAARKMTREDIITLALEILPDATMGFRQIEVLSRQGEFVGYKAIKKHFGGVPAFRKACEQEIARRRAKNLDRSSGLSTPG